MKMHHELRAGALAALLLFLAAAPAAADPNYVGLFEVVRPIAGRPSEMTVSGGLHRKIVALLESVVVEDQTVVVTLQTFQLNFFDLDDIFAFPVKLPPLAAGQHVMILRGHPFDGSTVVEEGRATFFVHPPIAVVLEPLEPASDATFRVRASGTSTGAEFTGPPTVVGNTVKVPMTLGCEGDCPIDPPDIFDWDITSEPIGPLPAGEYQLELVANPVPAAGARILWREGFEIAAHPVILRGGRFEVQIALDPPHGETPPRLVEPPTADSALFYFFSKNNWEVMVKVLDGCAINGHFWVYAAASTDLGYTLRVTDLSGGGGVKEYPNAAGTPAPALTDSAAFACP